MYFTVHFIHSHNFQRTPISYWTSNLYFQFEFLIKNFFFCFLKKSPRFSIGATRFPDSIETHHLAILLLIPFLVQHHFSRQKLKSVLMLSLLYLTHEFPSVKPPLESLWSLYFLDSALIKAFIISHLHDWKTLQLSSLPLTSVFYCPHSH